MTFTVTTFAFEAINLVVLMLVLHRLLYRPLRAGIDARRAAIEADLAKAKAAREGAEALEAEWKAREADLDALRERTRHEALDEAEQERGRLLARARDEADAEHARVSRLLETERAAALGWVRAEVWTRGTDLAGRLALALVPDRFDEALFHRLIDVVRARGADLAAVEDEVELTGAKMASPEQVEALREVVAAATGRAPRMTVREDGALLAGWVVRVGDLLFDGSLAGELEAFRDLARELEPE